MKKTNARDISKGGMLVVLSIIMLYASTVLTTTKLSLLGLSSAIVAVAVIETGTKGGALVYASTSILGLLLVPDKLYVLSYVCFFGFYPIAKYVIESIRRTVAELLLKLALFNASVALGYLAVNYAVAGGIALPFPVWIAVAVMQPAFLVYDYAMSLAIGYYIEKIAPRL